MINLMVYLSPRHGFDEEHKALARVQVDNALHFGWAPDKIWIMTNFPWQHAGIKAMQVSDDLQCPFCITVPKINVILNLFDQKMVGDEPIWFHDFDAYQLVSLDVSSIDPGLLLTDYGWKSYWNTGSFFFDKRAEQPLRLVHEVIYAHKVHEEEALNRITKDPSVLWYKRLNCTYNFGMRNIKWLYEHADKPIRVAHVHPLRRGFFRFEEFLIQQSWAPSPLFPPHLVALFRQHLKEMESYVG